MVAITTVLLTMTASVLLGRLSTTIVWVLLILGTTGLTVVLRLPVVRGNDDAAE
jgi:hypothetical protein